MSEKTYFVIVFNFFYADQWKVFAESVDVTTRLPLYNLEKGTNASVVLFYCSRMHIAL